MCLGRGRRRRLFPILSLAFLTTCAACAAFQPEGAESITPPPSYRALYAEAEACTGRHGNFALVTWYVVPGAWFRSPNGGRDAGHWEAPHTIYLSAAYRDHPLVVKHEAIHDLLQRGGHPDPPFANPCKATWESFDARAQ